LRLVLLIGIVSAFWDMTHEGARGITAPSLATLGASVAVVAGFGVLLGYALRYAADRTRKYWPITFFGYTLQMVVVPLLALAGYWPVAAVLIVAEQTGRAIRNPLARRAAGARPRRSRSSRSRSAARAAAGERRAVRPPRSPRSPPTDTGGAQGPSSISLRGKKVCRPARTAASAS